MANENKIIASKIKDIKVKIHRKEIKAIELFKSNKDILKIYNLLLQFDSIKNNKSKLNSFLKTKDPKIKYFLIRNKNITNNCVISADYRVRDNILFLDLYKTKYYLKIAYMLYFRLKNINEAKINNPNINSLNPKILGVSLLNIIKYRKTYWLVAQLKGEAIGKNQIHPAMSAGSVDCDDLIFKDKRILLNAISRELKEETNMETKKIKLKPYLFINELSVGSVSMIYLTNLDLKYIRNKFFNRKENKEVKDLVLININNLDKKLIIKKTNTSLLNKSIKYRPVFHTIYKYIQNNKNKMIELIR